MNMKKLVKLFVGLVAICVCATTAQAETRGVSDSEILIGMHTPLSGPLAVSGIPAVRATRARFDEVNAKGGVHGRKIKLIAEDSQYRVPLAVQKANKLVYRDKVFAMLAAMGSSHNLAAFKFQLKENVFSMFPGGYHRDLVLPLHKLKYMAISTTYDTTRTSVKYLIEKEGKKRFCLLGVDTGYTKEMIAGVNDQLKLSNMTMVEHHLVKATETNFMTPILSLRKAKCDVVLLGTFPRGTIISVATAMKLGWDVDFFANTGAFFDVVAKKLKNANLKLINNQDQLLDGQAVTERGKKYIEFFRKEYNEEPGVSAIMAYVYADLVVLGLEKAGRNLTVDSFAKGMESIKNYESPFYAPLRSFSSTSHMGHNWGWILKVKDGKWVPLNGKSLEYLTY